jgi:hypothetical protein
MKPLTPQIPPVAVIIAMVYPRFIDVNHRLGTPLTYLFPERLAFGFISLPVAVCLFFRVNPIWRNPREMVDSLTPLP